MKHERYATYRWRVVEAVFNREITYPEFAVWSYINYFCGGSDKGKQRPFMKGQKDVASAFNLSLERTNRIIKALEAKGFVKITYRVKPAEKGSKVRRYTSYKVAWKVMQECNGRLYPAHYYTRVPKKPL